MGGVSVTKLELRQQHHYKSAQYQKTEVNSLPKWEVCIGPG